MAQSSSSSLLLFLFAAAGCASRAENVNPSEYGVMHELRKSVVFRNDSGVVPWDDLSSPCDWAGVGCVDDAAGRRRVSSIRIGRLVCGGTLPAALGTLVMLTVFEAFFSNLTGSLPNFYGSVRLQELSVPGNRFTSIPSSLFDSKPDLRYVDLDHNNLLEAWEIPEDLLKSSPLLASFSAVGCNIRGALPPFFNALRLPGDVSASPSLTGLMFLFLDYNQFSGEMPDLSGLQSLKILTISHNNVSGPVPESLANIRSLTSVDLSYNNLSGRIPNLSSPMSVVTCGNPGLEKPAGSPC